MDPLRHRCFYAVRLSDAAVDEVARLIDRLRRYDADVAWTRSENIHLTLRFLGEISEAQLERAHKWQRQTSFESFSIGIRGLGAFPGLRSPRTLWAGIEPASEDDRRKLLAMHDATELWAREIGLPPENRRFAPHLTLGRVRRAGPALRPLIDEITTAEFTAPESQITRLLLMRSTLTQSGAVYEEL